MVIRQKLTKADIGMKTRPRIRWGNNIASFRETVIPKACKQLSGTQAGCGRLWQAPSLV